MSEKLVKKWLGEEKEKSKEREEQLKQKKDEELLELQNAIDLTLKNSFNKSLDDGCKFLAQIHHNLFDSAVAGSDKAASGLQFLKSKFLTYLPKDADIGLFFVYYSKHWFKLFLILESRASDFITWMSYKADDQINYNKIISELNETIVIDYSIIEKENALFSSVDLELKNILSSEHTDSKEIGTNLRRLIQTSLRLYLTNSTDSKLKLQYIAYFLGKQIKTNDINFNETIHEFAKAWFRKSLLFKQWFHTFIEAMEKDPGLERKMYNGYNWNKFNENSLQKVIEERSKNIEKKNNN